MTAARISYGGEPATDILRNLWLTWREALTPLGIGVDSGHLATWRDLQRFGASPFTGAGDIRPEAVAGLVEAAIGGGEETGG